MTASTNRWAYYNEIDPTAAQWIRNLIKAGHVAPGEVDERSIEDVLPSDVRGFAQCHFFAGIAVWSHALRRAGWADSRPVWTGSCPCQPFSVAGAGAGLADELHLWPAFHHLIKECSPAVVFGEQVASKAAEPWIDALQIDMEALGYGVAAIAFPASSVGAPHIRDRLYWVADAGSERRERREGAAHRRLGHGDDAGRLQGDDGTAGPGEAGVWLADAQRERVCPCQRGKDACAPRSLQGADGERQRLRLDAGELCGVCGLADAHGEQRSDREAGVGYVDAQEGRKQGSAEVAGLCNDSRPGPTNGFWRDADWLGCRDGKWRPVEPGTFPLVTGAAARVVRLRAYGNSITAPAAAAFISSYLEADCASTL